MLSEYQITNVYPLVIPNDGIVNVSFSAMNPSPEDWIGAYIPAVNADTVFDHVPVKFGYCTWGLESNYLTTGSGQLSFNLTNLRGNVSFYYFTGGFYWPAIFNTTVLVDSYNTSVAFENVDEPVRNRVVPTGNPDIYSVVWSAANSDTPTLMWGTSTGNYEYSSIATVSNISRSSLCGAPAKTVGWSDLGNIYNAKLVGMVKRANSYIYYKFGDAKSNLWSGEFAFWVPPVRGTNPPNRGTRVALMADSGVGSAGLSSQTITWQDTGEAAYNTTLSVQRLIKNDMVDALILAGDLSYADGYLANWDFFADMISPIAGSRLFLAQVGNHESDTPLTASNPGYGADSGGECSIVSLALYPQPFPATPNEPWYSYDIGLIHFLAMSTEHNFTVGSPQYLFLEADLQAVDKSVTPWTIFFGHRSLYVDSSECCGPGTDVITMKELQANIEPLLHKYGVQLAVAGHFHNVQRQAAVYQQKVVQHAKNVVDSNGNTVAVHHNANATVYMVIGTAGQIPILPTGMYSWSEKTVNASNGYAVVEAVNSTYLYWEYIDSDNDIVYDRVALIQPEQLVAVDNSGYNSISPGVIIAIVVSALSVVLGIGIMAYLAPDSVPQKKHHSESLDFGSAGAVEATVIKSSADSIVTVTPLHTDNESKC